ncbi:hypothetical protein SH467x_003247 [Pirellulaceae bacterium SH467]
MHPASPHPRLDRWFSTILHCLLPRSFARLLQFLWIGSLCSPYVAAQTTDIPPALQDWKEWVLWDPSQKLAPPTFDNAQSRLHSWSSQLNLEVLPDRGSWQMEVVVFVDSWVSLPGDSQNWPQNVMSNQSPIAVLANGDHPAVQLKPGTYQLRGEFRWNAIPQKIALPSSIGIVALVRDGAPIAIPNWDPSGTLWLNRQPEEQAEQDLLSVNVYRLIQDGIPLWLTTQVELSVSGRSREENLGCILPEGWYLSSIDAPIPVAIDDTGDMKVQVRPGKWVIAISAYRKTDLQAFQFAQGKRPVVPQELIGFQANPTFRVAEIQGLQAIDVQKTTYPEAWRSWQVYQWQSQTPFQLSEKMRGMGMQKPKGLAITRHFWLDDDGKGITFQDRLRGELQQSWRLDVSESHQLGMVRLDGERQLITSNPINGHQGVEIRSRNPNLEALGRIDRSTSLPATGWIADVDSLRITLSLPPGWRMFAVFGADDVEGDWLTAWSLLDLFLVLVFALAVYRLWGIPAGLLALVAFGISYHEPGSPRWTWLFLLLPVALLRVVNDGAGKRWLEAWRLLALGLILLNLVPFLSREIQLVLYPQLEQVGIPYTQRPMYPSLETGYLHTASVAESLREDSVAAIEPQQPSPSSVKSFAGKQEAAQAANLAFDPASRMQTGPAKPDWLGHRVVCRWDGPVTGEQQLYPVTIPLTVHRILAVIRCSLLVLLAATLLRSGTKMQWSIPTRVIQPTATSVLLLVFLSNASVCLGQIPDQTVLDQLRQRLLQSTDVIPNTTTIAQLDLRIEETRINMSLEVHAGHEVAIPIPGNLSIWSPASVRIEELGETNQERPSSTPPVSRRNDGHLWVVVPAGVHRIILEGYLAVANDWELGFVLAPRRVSITAPQWQVTGMDENGIPESQLFFTRMEKSGTEEAKYDQRVYRPIVMVERRLELGIDWKIHNRVTRLSSTGKAIALRIPLLPGERVISANADSDSRTVSVNLTADQSEFAWESEMEPTTSLELQASDSAADSANAFASSDYVERWVLISSPIWNIASSGLTPVYEESSGDLVPTWQAWPGEKVTLEVRRPQAVAGESVTVNRVARTISLGARQRKTNLSIDVVSSIGGDFVVQLEPDIEIGSLTIDKRKQPVRRMDGQLMVNLQPGEQQIELSWETNQPLPSWTTIESVQLPVVSANVTTLVEVPSNRWILWTDGPLRGPAVRMWIYLATALLLAIVLGGLSTSPLNRFEWVMLALGLTQLHAIAGIIVVGWLLWLGCRKQTDPTSYRAWQFNLLQILLVALTFIIFGILIVVVGKGLLGSPEMFIVGNGSYGNFLNWYAPKAWDELPRPSIVSISIWYYRLAMLLWALWLASALVRWLLFGWQAFSSGGRWRTTGL